MPEWLETLLGGLSALEVAFWLIAIGALVAAIVRLWPALRRFVDIIDAVAGLPAFITRTDKRIDEIHHEVHFNNGSSVKDATKRLEEAVASIDSGVAGLYTKVDDLAAMDDRLWQTIDPDSEE